MGKTYIGIDNGVSGAVAIITGAGESLLFSTPTRKEQSYTKTKQQISRVDFLKMYDLLKIHGDAANAMCLIERPYANPQGMKATVSAMRALEATLIAVEMLDIAYCYIDSREWQKALLPSGLKGPELKSGSLQIGCRLFPQLKDEIEKQKDADALLIAEYGRRQNL